MKRCSYCGKLTALEPVGDLYACPSQAGYLVAGANPEASFLTQLHRTDGIEQIGDRSGVWRLT